MNNPDVIEPPKTPNVSAPSRGSVAFVAEIRCEGRTMDELATRIAKLAGAVRYGSENFKMASKHTRCEVKPKDKPLNSEVSGAVMMAAMEELRL